jgi:hypothetical protein
MVPWAWMFLLLLLLLLLLHLLLLPSSLLLYVYGKQSKRGSAARRSGRVRPSETLGAVLMPSVGDETPATAPETPSSRPAQGGEEAPIREDAPASSDTGAGSGDTGAGGGGGGGGGVGDDAGAGAGSGPPPPDPVQAPTPGAIAVAVERVTTFVQTHQEGVLNTLDAVLEKRTLVEDMVTTITNSGVPEVVAVIEFVADKVLGALGHVPLFGKCALALRGLARLYQGVRAHNSVVQGFLGRLARLGVSLAKLAPRAEGIADQLERFRVQLENATVVVTVRVLCRVYRVLDAGCCATACVLRVSAGVL